MIKNLEERKEYIDSFIKTCEERFGIIVKVDTLIENNVTIVSPSLIKMIVNDSVPTYVGDGHTNVFEKSRNRKLCNLKNIYCMLVRDTGLHLKKIGEEMGCDHSTIIYRLNVGYDLLETDEEFRNLYINISKKVNPDIYPHARVTEYNKETPDNNRTDYSPVLRTGKYKVFRPDYQYRFR